jgi:hypothetical protein
MKNDFLSNMCCGAARVYRTLNKPIVSSDIDIDCRVKPDESSDVSVMSMQIKGKPTVKLLDLILILSAAKLFFSLIASLVRLVKR